MAAEVCMSERPKVPALTCVGSDTMLLMVSDGSRCTSSFLDCLVSRLSLDHNERSHLGKRQTCLTVLFRIAAHPASATVPPNRRRKFRVPVATAISFRATLACIATKLVWNVWPAPMPLRIW